MREIYIETDTGPSKAALIAAELPFWSNDLTPAHGWSRHAVSEPGQAVRRCSQPAPESENDPAHDILSILSHPMVLTR